MMQRMAVPGNSVYILSQSWQLSLICYCINNSWAGLKDFFFLLQVFHSSFSLNWLFILRFFCIMEIDFLINQMIFFSFWPPLRYHGKMFLYSFILFVPIRFFAYDLLCEANVLVNCQLTSLKLTRYNWQFFPMYIYIFPSISFLLPVCCVLLVSALRDHMIMM